jgi:hypothetical protein
MISATSNSEFIKNFVPTYAGYSCYFLRREYYKSMPAYSPTLCFTRHDSLAIFRMPSRTRESLSAQVALILANACTTVKKNPFEEEPIFLRIADNCQYFEQYEGQPATEIERPQVVKPDGVGVKAFRGRILLCLKGFKVHENTKVASPMLSVKQILVIRDTINVQPTACLLQNPTSDEEAAVAADDDFLFEDIA